MQKRIYITCSGLSSVKRPNRSKREKQKNNNNNKEQVQVKQQTENDYIYNMQNCTNYYKANPKKKLKQNV